MVFNCSIFSYIASITMADLEIGWKMFVYKRDNADMNYAHRQDGSDKNMD